jgi:hypothetical protein
MTAGPAPRTDAIAVLPASLGTTGDAVLALAAEVRRHALHSLSAGVVGSPSCADALAGAGRLVEQAWQEAAHSLEQIARALHAASGAYGLADLVAFRPASR